MIVLLCLAMLTGSKTTFKVRQMLPDIKVRDLFFSILTLFPLFSHCFYTLYSVQAL